MYRKDMCKYNSDRRARGCTKAWDRGSASVGDKSKSSAFFKDSTRD